jgi:PAS domain S-box-containing protein
MFRLIVIFLYFSLLFLPDARSQVKRSGAPYIKNYTIDNYSPPHFRASPQNWQVFQDSSGFLYFGNTDGLLIYDGADWRFKYLPNHSIARSIGSDSENNLYIGGESEFGLFKIDSFGKYNYHSLLSKVPDSVKNIRDIWSIDSFRDTVIFRSKNKLFFYHDDSIVDVIKTQYQFFHHFKHNGNFFVFEAGKGLTKLKDGQLKLVPDGSYFKNFTAWAVFPIGKDSLLFASPINGLSIYKNGKFTNWDIPASDFLKETRIYCGTRLKDGNFAFGTSKAGVVIMNKEGEIVQVYNKDNGLQNNVVLDISLDHKGNIWVALSNGISYIKINSPFTYYTNNFNIPRQNYYVAKYQDNLYFSSDEGVYIKPFQDISGKFKVNKGQLIEGTSGQSWLFQHAGEFLLCGHNPGILVFKDNKLHKTLEVPFNVWEIKKDPKNPNTFFACTTEGIYVIKLKNGDISIDHFIAGYSGNSLYAEFDTLGNLWVSDEIDGIKRLKLNEERDSVINKRKFTEDDGLPSIEGNWVTKMEDRILITNPSHKGFYHYNADNDSIEPLSQYNSKFNIGGPVTLFQKGPRGNYWIRDDGLVKIFNKEGLVADTPFQKFRGRNLERLSFIDSSIAVFGTDEFVLLYYLSDHFDFFNDYSTHIRKVKCLQNDSVIFYGYKKGNASNSGSLLSYTLSSALPHKMNAIRFDYSASFFEEPEKTRFMVWLEGYEDKPQDWIDETNKEYTNLKEGNYVFHVIAKNIYGVKSKESVYRFSVDPPWYRTVYAYLGYIVVFILVLYAGIRLYVKKLKADRDRLERIVQQRTSEIEQQKEEIKVQAEELERINQELQKLSLVASKTDNGVIIADSKDQIEWVNEGFTRLFGYNLTEWKHEKGPGLENLRDEHNHMDEVLKEVKGKKKSVVFESAIETKNKESVTVQTTLTPITDNRGQIEKYIAISTDVTKLKETQKALRKLIATKDKFFSIIAHDLKNPFHSLMGISELLVSNQNNYEEEKLKELHKHLYKVTHQGYQLLTNLLEWARSQTGRLKFYPEKINIAELVEDTIDMISSTADSKDIRINNLIDPDRKVKADKNTITTVIRNLISNAIKYSETNEEVKIYSEDNGDFVKISIEDNGVGISPENIDKLFRIDVNFSTRGTDDESGTGLGLILCKEFVERNGGEIFVESILGKGSTFSFTLMKGN